MAECKRCGSAQVVKNGRVREKQRYLCKQCGYHFVEGDQRETGMSDVLKALCTVFQALGAKNYRWIGKYMKRDISLIHKWMNEKPVECNPMWKNSIHDFWSIQQVCAEIVSGGVENGCWNKILLVDNEINDLYIAVILQRRD